MPPLPNKINFMKQQSPAESTAARHLKQIHNRYNNAPDESPMSEGERSF